MQNAYLVFDIGTGNTRVALVGEDGAILDIAKENTRMYTDPIASRAQYFKPQEWQDAVFSLIRGLLAAHPDVAVRAVTGSTLRQGIVLVGHDGEASSATPTPTAAARASCRSLTGSASGS